MVDVIDFLDFVSKRHLEIGCRRWTQQFGYPFDRDARIMDLQDHVLLTLAQGGEDGNAIIDELIVGARGLATKELRSLEPAPRMILLDLSLCLIDQFRFECMTRLELIAPVQARSVPLVDLLRSDKKDLSQLKQTPQLRREHPHYHRFQTMLQTQKETFIRQQIPSTLQLFQKRVEKRPNCESAGDVHGRATLLAGRDPGQAKRLRDK